MNYYIQGNKEKASQIKAAFNKFVSIQEMAECDFSQEEYLFYTGQEERGTFVYSTWVDGINANIIKTHPDYKELELPVEPNFKVGDKISWINHDCDTQTITDIRDGSYITVDKHGIRCALKFAKQDEWELVPPKPHYDIANFHAGMPVLVRDGKKDWRYVPFSHITNGSWVFNAVGTVWEQCIPFEGNEHLLGTTDMCDEQYINW